MFLPTAVLISHGAVLAFAWGHMKGIHVFVQNIGHHLKSMATFIGIS